MEHRPMTDEELQRLAKGQKMTKNIVMIFFVLGTVTIVIAALKLIFSDVPGAGIIAAVSLFFFFPAIGNVFSLRKIKADMSEKTTIVSQAKMTAKHFVARKTFFSYYVRIGKKEYCVPKETYDRIAHNEDVFVCSAFHSGELLSLKDSAGTAYRLI